MLTTYIQQTRRLLNDQNGKVYTDAQLSGYVNSGRMQIAAEGQCVRSLITPTAGVLSVTVLTSGSGYVNPTVTIAAPADVDCATTATAVAVLSGTSIASIAVTLSGGGYTSAPAVTITGGSGSGATASSTIGFLNQAILSKEVYPASAVTFDPALGIQSVLGVRSIALLYSRYRYVLARASWSKMQAIVRNYTSSYLYIPMVAAQFGQGVDLSFYLYPIPNATYGMEWDAICLPATLTSDASVEAIPKPWQRCVQYYAAYMAVQGSMRNEDADRLWAYFERFMKRARAFSQPNQANNFYGRSLG